MKFLLILLAAVIEFMIASAEPLRRRRWTSGWVAWLARVSPAPGWWRGWWGAAITLGVPVLAVWLFFDLLFSWSALLGHMLSLAVLLCMLGPSDLNRDVERHRAGLGEASLARAPAPAFVAMGRELDLGGASGDADFDGTRAELAGLAVAAERAWFEPMFWFFVLGPVGAVLYRLCVELERAAGVDDSVAAAIADVRAALEWLPSRLTVVALGLAGTLVPALDSARAGGLGRWDAGAELVGRAALAAMDDGRIDRVIGDVPRIYRLNQMHALLRRTLNVWLVLFAIGALLFA